MKVSRISIWRPPPRRFILHPSALLLWLALSGCARYEYDVVQPAELAGHVGETAWVALRRGDDLDYVVRSAEDRLIMRIQNRGERAVKLLGADSAVIDPRGESHPMASATIPPGTFVTRIFPPPRPTTRAYGPSMHFGVGAAYGHGHGHYHAHGYPAYGYYPYRHGDPFYSSGFYDDLEPHYYTVYDPNDRTYFAWPAETAVRFLFAFQPEGGELFRHEFLIRKRKM